MHHAKCSTLHALHEALSRVPAQTHTHSDRACGAQDWQAQAVQCEGDISFQQGQMQQAYISHICSQLQQPILVCVQNAAQQSGVPQEAQEELADLHLMLVQIQSHLLSLAPRNCITQVCLLEVATAHCLMLSHKDWFCLLEFALNRIQCVVTLA